MSGLNLAFLILDEMVKESIERQRLQIQLEKEKQRLEMEKQRKHQANVNALKNDAQRFEAHCQQLVANAKSATLSTGDKDTMHGVIAQIEALRGQAQSLASLADSASEDEISTLTKQLQTLRVDLGGSCDTLEYVAQQNEKAARATRELQELEAFSGAADVSFADIEQKTATSDEQKGSVSALLELKERILPHLRAMELEEELPQDLRGKISAAIARVKEIQDPGFLRNYGAVTVSPLIKEAKDLLSQYEKNHEEFETLSNRYEVLCEMYQYVPQVLDASDDSMKQLRALVELIELEASEDAQKAYISDTVDAVMTEMGYGVLGSRNVTKQSGKRFRNELFDYGDGSVVNVTYAQDGKISMELGALDTEDRLPDEDEAQELCQRMEHFCDDYDIIQKKLLERGVILARPDRRPPSPAYAQIINMSDFDMQAPAQTFHVSKQRKKRSNPHSAAHEDAL